MSRVEEQGLDDGARKALGLVSDAAEVDEEQTALSLLRRVWERLPDGGEDLVEALRGSARGRLSKADREAIERLIDDVNEVV